MLKGKQIMLEPSYGYGYSEVAGDVGERVPILRDRPIGEADSGYGRAVGGVNGCCRMGCSEGQRESCWVSSCL